MADHKLLLKRGLKANMPALSVGEIVFATDEKRLYTGSSTGNQAVALLSEVTAKYTKPSTGIPESDLATAVRTKLTAGSNALADAKTYTDNKISDLINGASSQYDTLKELADAIVAGDTVHTSLLNSIATKTNQTDFDSHKNNKNNPHAVTKSQVGLGNVDNTSDLNKPISTATQGAINNVISDISITNSKLNMHIDDSIAHLTSTEHDKLTSVEVGANKYVLPTMSASIKGGARVGENIKLTGEVISVENASTSVKGVVQLNNTLTSSSVTQAATANVVKGLNDRLIASESDSLTARLNSEEAIATANSAKETAEDVEQYFYEIVNGSQEQEIIDARDGNQTLGERIDKIENHINGGVF